MVQSDDDVCQPRGCGSRRVSVNFRPGEQHSHTPFIRRPILFRTSSLAAARSFAAKGAFINDAGLLGFAMWEAAGDFEDVLLDAISEAIGIEEVGC